ncbi:MAG: exodeoxyribonuclease VII small subunit [Planctomycetota bacterium]
MTKEKLSFEKAMVRLEKIVSSIEEGKVGLEDSITQCEEGMSLIRQCRQVLAESELKIQRLQADGPSGVEATDAKDLPGT